MPNDGNNNPLSDTELKYYRVYVISSIILFVITALVAAYIYIVIIIPNAVDTTINYASHQPVAELDTQKNLAYATLAPLVLIILSIIFILIEIYLKTAAKVPKFNWRYVFGLVLALIAYGVVKLLIS